MNNRYSLLILLVPIFLYGKSIESSKDIISYLSEENNWNFEKFTEDSITIKTKTVEGIPFQAIMVEKTLSISTSEITQTVYEVERYKEVLKSMTTLETQLLEKFEDHLNAYQLVTTPFPLFDDRTYCFSMKKYDRSDSNENRLISWELIDRKSAKPEYLEKLSKDARYVDQGAGIWIANPNPDGTYNVSYRLLVDIGGYVPGFIIEMINEVTIINIFRDIIIEVEKKSY